MTITGDFVARSNALWIDVDNSPHVPLFVPIIKRYQAENRPVLLTARQHSQTTELLQNAGLDGLYQVIGEHDGKSKVKKIVGLGRRAYQLAHYVKRAEKTVGRVGVALSHGSRSMVLAAKALGIPLITMYDYEHTETFIFNMFSDRVMIPDRIPDATLDRIGLKPEKRVKYPGYKEELYLNYYESDADFLKKVSQENGVLINADKIIVTLRPPASTANYHSEASDRLLETLLERLLGDESVFTIVLPRTPEQKNHLEQFIHARRLSTKQLLIPKRAVNGLDLAYHSDVLISGGGTMNREAALLGVPVYSIFAGVQGALDADMEKRGMIQFIRAVSDIDRIQLRKRTPNAPGYKVSDRVEQSVLTQIELMKT